MLAMQLAAGQNFCVHSPHTVKRACLFASCAHVHCVYMYIDSVLLVPAVSMATEFFITNPNDIRKLNDDKSQILYEDSDRPQVMMS